ncbi:hypothetical protein M501DRAFT_845194 [Patellaria atrata CBS 101060]|uniref:Uncharacterized protein n=1 Tax=Patellaria atrata CBS 101060 TaxID=1346257 RepID=A0A9P4VSU5_9PEZI|nr:hypothetical protein M501DRAFT_845194 [Patellaria atrata CBS 101060]
MQGGPFYAVHARVCEYLFVKPQRSEFKVNLTHRMSRMSRISQPLFVGFYPSHEVEELVVDNDPLRMDLPQHQLRAYRVYQPYPLHGTNGLPNAYFSLRRAINCNPNVIGLCTPSGSPLFRRSFPHLVERPSICNLPARLIVQMSTILGLRMTSHSVHLQFVENPLLSEKGMFRVNTVRKHVHYLSLNVELFRSLLDGFLCALICTCSIHSSRKIFVKDKRSCPFETVNSGIDKKIFGI